MNLKHKHWALIAVGGLVATLLILVLWYTFRDSKGPAPENLTATSTLSTQNPLQPATPAVPTHITEHAAKYNIDLTYPSATPLTMGNAEAVAQMKAGMQTIAGEFKKNYGLNEVANEDMGEITPDSYPFSLDSEYKTYTGKRTVSYVFQVYESTDGNHPHVYFRTFTFDTKTGAKLSLGNLFSSQTYLSVLSTRALADLPGIIQKMNDDVGGNTDTDFIKSGTEPVASNFQSFAIDGATLRLIFPPYQIGPWALGTVVDPIPFSVLTGSIKAEYQ